MAWVLAALFAALAVPRSLRHVMWRDEGQAWLLVRDSRSLADLAHHLRYEGHPWLWYLLLYPLRAVTDSPLAMQAVHAIVATVAAWLVLRHAPFPRWQRAVFVLGYFPFFEYATISRGYALGALLLYAACAACGDARWRRWGAALAAFGLAQTSIYGILIAVSLGLALLVESRLASGGTPSARAGGRLVLLPWLGGIALGVAEVLPPPDAGWAAGWTFHLSLPRLLGTVGRIAKAYLPVPHPTRFFWCTSLLDGHPGVAALLGAALVGAAALSLARRPAALTLLAGGTCALLAFSYVKYPGQIRHDGHLFLVLVAALWLAPRFEAVDLAGGPGRLLRGLERVRGPLLGGLLVVQAVAGAMAAGIESAVPFSTSRMAARFIEEELPPGTPVVAFPDALTVSVAGYLDRPVYYPNAARLGSFVVWNRARLRQVSGGEILRQARGWAERRGRDALLLLAGPLAGPPPGVEPLARFLDGVVYDEVYYLYRVRPPR